MFYSMEIGGVPEQCKTGNFGSLCRQGKHKEFCYKAGKSWKQGKYFDCDYRYEKYMYLFIFINFKKNY